MTLMLKNPYSQRKLHAFRACNRLPVDATPVWFMRQAGRYMPEYRKIREKHTLLEICYQPELAAEVTLQPVNALGVMQPSCSPIFSCLLFPWELV